MKHHNLAQCIHEHATHAPDSLALAFKDRTLSYRQLAQHADATAKLLTPSRPEGQPFRVGLLTSRGMDACVALLGACWAGATYVPFNIKSSEHRIRDMVAACELAAIITDDKGIQLLTPELIEALPDVIVHVGQTEPPAWIRAVHMTQSHLSEWNEPVQMSPDQAAYIIFTSGTTGTPKGVMIRCEAACHYRRMIQSVLGLTSTDRAMETCDLSFDFSVHNMFSIWQAGGSLHILPDTSVMNAIKFVRTHGLTVWNSVPSLAGMLKQLKVLAPDALSSLRVSVFGGEQLPQSLVQVWRLAAPNSSMFNLYGPTEATVFCMAHRVDLQESPIASRNGVPIGLPLPGNEACIMGPDGQLVHDSSPGELWIAGEQLADGYMKQADLTAEKFPVLNGKRWYRTGDLACQDEHGIFHCLGRIDNQVKVMGYRIELEEVDAHLRAASNEDLVGCVPWPVDDQGMAYGIVGFIASEPLDVDPLISTLKKRMPAYMVPQKIICIPSMPVNSSGKADRKALNQYLTRCPT
jgi:amino acid adenylation domain-containing protein